MNPIGGQETRGEWRHKRRLPQDDPKFKQRSAQLLTGYGDITLRREGDWTIVEIDYGGKIVEVIREPYDNNFCHTVTSIGIEEELKRKGLL